MAITNPEQSSRSGADCSEVSREGGGVAERATRAFGHRRVGGPSDDQGRLTDETGRVITHSDRTLAAAWRIAVYDNRD